MAVTIPANVSNIKSFMVSKFPLWASVPSNLSVANSPISHKEPTAIAKTTVNNPINGMDYFGLISFHIKDTGKKS